jgi:hypothetical protein
MINPNMKDYDYFTLGGKDEYGQEIISQDPIGKIKLSIHSTSTTIGTNINYKDATYLALTHDKNINDSYVIIYGDEKLKVLYVIPSGRYTQVFLAEM